MRTLRFTMARLKRKDPRNRKKQQTEFLEKLEKLANVTQACRFAKVSRRTIYNWLDTDPDFKVKYDESVKIAVDLLEDEAVRRAYAGTKEPVFQGGKKVGTITKYSDTLLIFLLKKRKPDIYKDVIHTEVSAPGGGPVQTESVNTVVLSNVDYGKLPTAILDEILKARIEVQD